MEEQEWVIQIRVRLPKEVSRENVTAWAKYVTGYTGSLPAANPLCDTDLEAFFCNVDK